MDKAHEEILEIIRELDERHVKELANLNFKVGQLHAMHDELRREHEVKTELLRGRIKELEDKHEALKAWTAESLGKIHQSAEGHGGSTMAAVRRRK